MITLLVSLVLEPVPGPGLVPGPELVLVPVPELVLGQVEHTRP